MELSGQAVERQAPPTGELAARGSAWYLRCCASARSVLLVLLCGISQSIAATNEPIRVFMQDGQIGSHLLRIFVTKDLTQEDKPVLVAIPEQLFDRMKPSWSEQPIPAYQ